jgi:hypothetical protein
MTIKKEKVTPPTKPTHEDKPAMNGSASLSEAKAEDGQAEAGVSIIERHL